MDETRTKKIQVASRQLDAAIGLLFADGDLVAVHTLAAAASNMLADLEPNQSSDRSSQPVSAGEAIYRDVARTTQGLLKNANLDPDPTRQLSPTDTAAQIAAAILKLYEVVGAITVAQSVFNLWHLACHFDSLDESFPHREMIKTELGSLARRTWPYQTAMGRVALEKALTTASAAIGAG